MEHNAVPCLQYSAAASVSATVGVKPHGHQLIRLRVNQAVKQDLLRRWALLKSLLFAEISPAPPRQRWPCSRRGAAWDTIKACSCELAFPPTTSLAS